MVCWVVGVMCLSETLGGRHPLSHNPPCTSNCNSLKLFTKTLKHFASVHLHWSTFLIMCNFDCLEKGMKDCRSASLYSLVFVLDQQFFLYHRMKYWDFNRIYFTLCTVATQILHFDQTHYLAFLIPKHGHQHSCWHIVFINAMNQLLKILKTFCVIHWVRRNEKG